MADELKCAVCGVGLTMADADHAVATDAGPVHRECFEGPVPVGSAESAIELLERMKADPVITEDLPHRLAEEEAEEAARREYSDVPLPPDGPDAVFEDAAGERWAIDHKLRRELDDDDGSQLERYEQMMGHFQCTPFSMATPHVAVSTPATARLRSSFYRLGMAALGAPPTDEEYPNPHSVSPSVRGRRPDEVIFDDYDLAEERTALMERDERWYGGHYDEDGMGY